MKIYKNNYYFSYNFKKIYMFCINFIYKILAIEEILYFFYFN